jgi:hypothetical protein
VGRRPEDVKTYEGMLHKRKEKSKSFLSRKHARSEDEEKGRRFCLTVTIDSTLLSRAPTDPQGKRRAVCLEIRKIIHIIISNFLFLMP